MFSNSSIPRKRRKTERLARAKDFLFYNLPAVRYKESYIIFSPYAKAVARVPIKGFHKEKIRHELEKQGFFKGSLWKKSKKEVLITLFVTTDCNFRCKYCYLMAGEKPEYMSSKTAIGIVKSMLRKNQKKISIHFFGGEPTLNMPVIKDVVNFIKKKKIRYAFHITTNGAVSDENLNYLIKNKFGFTVSMDSIPNINDQQRVFVDGRGTSSIVVETIKKLIKKKANVSIRATVTNSNVKYLPKAIEYWSDLGVKYIHFELMNPIGRGKELPNIEIKEYIKYIKKALDVAEKKNVFIINSAYMNLLTPSDYFCMSCKGERLIFYPDGTLSLCYEVQKPVSIYKSFIIGKYDKQKNGFIINKANLKKMSSINIENFKKCKNCFAKYICAGGCPKRNLEATGSFFEPNPTDCKIKKELIRDAIIRIYKSSKKGKLNPVFGTSIFENI